METILLIIFAGFVGAIFGVSVIWIGIKLDKASEDEFRRGKYEERS